MKLPIPRFKSVQFVFDNPFDTVLIAHDHMSGKDDVFTVIRLDRATGQAFTIGRELPMDMALEVAKRPREEDGKPLV